MCGILMGVYSVYRCVGYSWVCRVFIDVWDTHGCVECL